VTVASEEISECRGGQKVSRICADIENSKMKMKLAWRAAGVACEQPEHSLGDSALDPIERYESAK